MRYNFVFLTMKTLEQPTATQEKPTFRTEAEAHKNKLGKANELLAKSNLEGLERIRNRKRGQSL